MDHKYHRAALIPQLINAYGEWVENYIDQGFRVYLVTFKFNNIPGSNTPTISEMLREIENQFYPTLIKHVERWPLKRQGSEIYLGYSQFRICLYKRPLKSCRPG